MRFDREVFVVPLDSPTRVNGRIQFDRDKRATAFSELGKLRITILRSFRPDNKEIALGIIAAKFECRRTVEPCRMTACP